MNNARAHLFGIVIAWVGISGCHRETGGRASIPPPLATNPATAPSVVTSAPAVLGSRAPVVRFLEVEARANSAVFVCDASGSMIAKFDALKTELRQAIKALSPDQRFNIVFFQDEGAIEMTAGLFNGTDANKSKAAAFLDDASTTGVTDPVPGIEAAFRAKPEVIYLVTDGDFPDNDAVVKSVQRLNPHKSVRVNIILYLSSETSEDDVSTAFLRAMRRLASDNGGQFKIVNAREKR